MPFPTLHTTRLTLRPFRRSDAPIVQRLAGDPEVALKTDVIPYPYGDGVAEEWIDSLEPAWEEGRLLTLAVTENIDGLVGTMSLSINSRHRSAELGYWIGRPFWNKGYATEAGRALLRYGFDEIGLNRIQARQMPRNAASARVLEKLGMRLEGVHRQCLFLRGEFEDLAVYAILASDV